MEYCNQLNTIILLLQSNIDLVKLNFNPESLFVLNLSVGFIMFGVALELKVKDFKRIIQNPVSVGLGVVSQFFLLPFLTYILCLIWKPHPTMALGMILIAACPGGNISNFMSLWAKGNAALSVSLTAIATFAAMFMTPFNFMFYGTKYAPDLVQTFHLDYGEMIKLVVILLGVPLVCGMLFNHYFPKITSKILKPIKMLSILIFTAIVIIAVKNNSEYFAEWVPVVIGLVFVHNLLALATGFGIGKIFKRNLQDCKTLSIETGIQNSGLGLVLIFDFFNGLGGMAIVAAWWGIWHIIAGLTTATLFSKFGNDAS